MLIYLITKVSPEGSSTTSLKIFQGPIEFNSYMQSLSKKQDMGLLKDYSCRKIDRDSLGETRIKDLEDVSLKDFILIIREMM